MRILTQLTASLLLMALLSCSNQPDSASEPGEQACKVKVKDPGERMCTTVYQPVCGCDGVTYSNGCVASTMGITRSTPGACEGDDGAALQEQP